MQQKSIFPTKIKDGIFFLTVVLVVMAGSLYVDAVKGMLHGQKFRVSIYLEGTTVEEKLTEGNMVNIFRRAVGRIDRVSFFTAKVLRPSEISQAKLDEIAGTPDQMEKLRELQKELWSQPEIVTGVKLDCSLYTDQIGTMMPLFGQRSEAKIAAAGMLGEPFLQIYPGDQGGGLGEGDRIGFPRNDPAASAPGSKVSTFGVELAADDDVRSAMQELSGFKARQKDFERLLEEIAKSAESEDESTPSAPQAPASTAPAAVTTR